MSSAILRNPAQRLLSPSALRAANYEIEQATCSPHVFHLRLSRPRHNALTVKFMGEIHDAFGELARIPECRAIVLSGKGRSFSSGLDLVDPEGMQFFMSLASDPKLDASRRGRNIEKAFITAHSGVSAAQKCPVPVIAAIHKYCLAAGLELALSADIKLASKDAIFQIHATNVGIASADGGTVRISKLQQTRQDAWTREIVLTGRRFGAEEALRYGMISRVYDDYDSLMAGALEMAKQIAEKSPVAVQGTKRNLNAALERRVADALEFGKTWSSAHRLTEDIGKSTALLSGEQSTAKFDIFH